MSRPRVLTDEQRLANRKAAAHRQYLKRKERKTEADREARRLRDRARPRKPSTPEQRARDAERMRKARANRTPEQRAATLAKQREYNKSYTRTPDQVARSRVTTSLWGKANLERIRLRKRETYKEKDIGRVYAQNRRARKRARAGKVSPDVAERLFKLQRGRCAACRVRFVRKQLELDHVVPLAVGGEHDDRNLQLLCMPCNRSKGTKAPEQFMRERGMLL
ncbi:MAG TPA: HNH endonuclease signature motif containing protein [Burkholderiaceae bacterium]|nr:HNH endonuclease signature motif containing protein [Burkholderiaceae bacterium]